MRHKHELALQRREHACTAEWCALCDGVRSQRRCEALL